MGQEIFFSALPLIGGIGFVAFIALGVAALMETKRGGSMSDAVRRLYLYLVSFLTLLVISVSVISLLDLGLRTWVFTKADPASSYQSQPPTPYLPVQDVNTKAVPVGGYNEKLTCANDTCTLTADQKTSIDQWAMDYKNWKENSAPSQKRAELLVTAFSFLIIAGAAFWVHWKFAGRDAKASGETSTRSTYLWAMSFVWLITSVVTLGFLLTTALKAGFNIETSNTYTEPAMVTAANTDAVKSFVTCGTSCGLSGETIALATEWQDDYAAWLSRTGSEQKSRSRQNALATQLAIVLIALPLFGYHFRDAWRENKAGKDGSDGKKPQQPNATLT